MKRVTKNTMLFSICSLVLAILEDDAIITKPSKPFTMVLTETGFAVIDL